MAATLLVRGGLGVLEPSGKPARTVVEKGFFFPLLAMSHPDFTKGAASFSSPGASFSFPLRARQKLGV
jgi:hypothetical protein